MTSEYAVSAVLAALDIYVANEIAAARCGHWNL